MKIPYNIYTTGHTKSSASNRWLVISAHKNLYAGGIGVFSDDVKKRYLMMSENPLLIIIYVGKPWNTQKPSEHTPASKAFLATH